jgi:hypothetical protein
VKRTEIRRTSWMKRGTTPMPRSSKPLPAVNVARKAKRQQRYKRYLSSAAWKRICAETHRLSGHRCQRAVNGARCPNTRATHRLVCDHLGYFRFGGAEIPGKDTRTLCAPCDRIETKLHRANHFSPR